MPVNLFIVLPPRGDRIIIQSIQQLVEIVAVMTGIVDFIENPCDPLAVKLGQNVMQIPVARVREPVSYKDV